NFQKEKKSHWQSYETKDSKELKTLQKTEYYTSPDPIIEKIKTGKTDRKTFLKLMGASSAMLTLNCVRRPVEKIVPYVNAPEFIKPGASNYYTSVCGGCSAGCGMLVRTRDGRPLKLEGNPDHPVSKGALCVTGQTSIMDLYDPDRAKEPFRIENGKATAIDWAKLDLAIKEKLNTTKNKTRILTGGLNSPSTISLIAEFLKSVGGGKHYESDSTSPEDAISIGQEISYGKGLVPNYRFDLAKVIVSVDSDFLGTWISPVEFTKGFSKGRNLKEGQKSFNKLISVESFPTVTGSNADERVVLKPGHQKKFLLALAIELSKLGTKGNIPNLSSADLAKEIGVELSVIEKIAKDLNSHKGESLVVAGGTTAQTQDAIEIQVAVNMLNSILGNDGKTIDHVSNRRDSKTNYAKNLEELKKELEKGEVGVLFIQGVNLAYEHPNTDWKTLLSKAALVVSLSDRLDETALLSGYLATSTHFLESWGDSESVRGVIAIRQPTIRPLFNYRSFEDSLIQWAGGSLLGGKNFYEILKNTYSKKTNWENLLREGVIVNSSELSRVKPARGFKGSLSNDSTKIDGLSLVLYTTVAMGDGSGANNSFRQELPDPITKVTWDNFVAISPVLGKKLDIRSNDLVKVKTSNGKEITLSAQIQPAMHSEAVGVALGYGRTAAGKVGNGVGQNSYLLAVSGNNGNQYSGISVTLEKTGKKYKLATTQDHHMMNPSPVAGTKWEERPLIQSASFQDYLKKPDAGIVKEEIPMISINGVKTPARGLNPVHEYKGNKWGLSVDLSLCTGCGACVVACQVENNIPAAGRNEVRVGREMHWLRIDRYYIGDPEKPETMEIAHQPVMCQHCDSAPCETVCPVAATTHGQEGTNDMVYNRCVGTRYCSNNCPYKVRRYNWMNHWVDTPDSRAPKHLAFNPDVTVRTRGVMEKCTFCAGRVAERKIQAKNEGRNLKDREIRTACEETCPADAIVFGNTNDPESKVSKYRKDPRSYTILDFLNIGPQVGYMTRIRNKG
ncbi:MAG: 4Fe-4S dicluster domain-containing protein, partial [Leptospiraceae bacterium]|nr:4Fe-4S dicluster domain-containing protein [Leptospiraceae bacterium]